MVPGSETNCSDQAEASHAESTLFSNAATELSGLFACCRTRNGGDGVNKNMFSRTFR